jgi:hypothetical protein
MPMPDVPGRRPLSARPVRRGPVAVDRALQMHPTAVAPQTPGGDAAYCLRKVSGGGRPLFLGRLPSTGGTPPRGATGVSPDKPRGDREGAMEDSTRRCRRGRRSPGRTIAAASRGWSRATSIAPSRFRGGPRSATSTYAEAHNNLGNTHVPSARHRPGDPGFRDRAELRPNYGRSPLQSRDRLPVEGRPRPGDQRLRTGLDTSTPRIRRASINWPWPTAPRATAPNRSGSSPAPWTWAGRDGRNGLQARETLRQWTGN